MLEDRTIIDTIAAALVQAEAAEPELYVKRHKVTCPNGVVLRSTWYRHPWVNANGKLSSAPRDGSHKGNVKDMDAAYRRWKAAKDRGEPYNL